MLSLIAPSTRRIISSTSAILTTSKTAYELHTIMEPLSAFALAVNVIQVIDFSAKLLREAHELHESSTGHTAEHVELHQISQSLAHMCDSLSTAQPQSGVISHGVFEKASAKAIAHNVSKIAASAKAVAQELMALIDRLQLKHGTKGRWRSFRQALATLWKKDEIERLQKRLKELRDQLQVILTTHIR
jgi:HAMP domain-containing protein